MTFTAKPRYFCYRFFFIIINSLR